MKKLNLIASRHSAFYTPLIGTIAGGFLETEDLAGEYSVATDAAPAVAQVADGRQDLAQSAVSASWPALAKGIKPSVVHFAQINRHDGFFIASRQPVKDFEWSMLKNGQFMYVHGGQPEAMLRYALHQNLVALSELQNINAGDTESMMQRWRAGDGDFFHEQGGYPQQLAHEGIAQVVASVGEIIGPVAFSSLCCTWDFLETDTAKRFYTAYQKSREWSNSAPAVEIAGAISSFFAGYSQHALAEAVSFYQRLGTWSGQHEIEEPLYEKALDVFQHAGLIQDRYPMSSVVKSL